MKHVHLVSTALLICLVALPASGQTVEPPTLTGWLNIVWGDSDPATQLGEQHRRITLTDDTGRITELSMSDELLQGAVLRWNGRRVKAFPAAEVSASQPVPVAALQLLGDATAPGGELGGVSGSQPWISLLCKFADVADEPQDLAFFQGMYANQPGGLDHYWREVSYDTIDIVGSTAIDWVNLPGSHTSYVPTPGSGTTANLNQLFTDCTAAVDSIVDFSNGGTPFAGINLMFNELLDCCAWGGGRFATLDGITKTWRTTWEPPWGYANEGVIAHEMGHGFGLPHANNWDGDNNPYDSPWDVMSAATSYAVNDPTYGNLGKHINAYHKDRLGWFTAEQRFEPESNTSTTVNLDHTALANSSNYQLIRIPIVGSDRWYTVEARQRGGDYESSLPGDCVIIHEVNPSRGEPAWAYDADDPPANFSDNEGTMWRVGETFSDSANQISLSIDSMTATGFVVTVTYGEVGALFTDGFESADTSMWSSASSGTF